MGKVEGKYSSADVEFSYITNFDVDKWISHFDKKGLTEVVRTAADSIAKIVKGRIKARSGPHGKWPAKKKWTKNRTGELEKSIEVVMVNDEAFIGTKRYYGRSVQFGGNYAVTPRQAVWMWANLFGKQGNPYWIKKIRREPRPFLGWNKRTEEVVDSVMKRHLDNTESNSYKPESDLR